jgi:hypothetical protein
MSNEDKARIRELELRLDKTLDVIRRLRARRAKLREKVEVEEIVEEGLSQELLKVRETLGAANVELSRLRREYEEPGVRCCHGHLVALPRKVWDCPLCVRERAKKVERLFWSFSAKVMGDRSAEEAGAGDEFQAVIEGLAELINERVLAKLKKFNDERGGRSSE